ncbi:MAG TPA: ABC transporter ATP-binding protein [Patescibacteria group bacterium]|jgi:ABC-2 type transport system ATP-binding protein|nr:ABC transporter ATP-binding protein [Patescibacteria group bacterium]
MTAAPVIQADGLSRWYKQVIGINDVSLRIEPGITGLLGPNGAGKSTFMKLITGQIRPSRGTCLVLGQPVWNNPSLMRRVGFCPEQDAFYSGMTGLKWVRGLLTLNGLTRDEAHQRALKALGDVDLIEAKDKKIGAYSKGMRQRVKLAQAIAHDPELLILDEPLSGMDPMGRRSTIKLIKEWAAQGRHIVVSSHILHEIEAMTSTILLVNHGRIVAEGNVHEIRELIEDHPHRIFIQCEDPRQLASRLVGWPMVAGMRLDADGVEIQTSKPDAFFRQLPEVILADNVKVTRLLSPDDNLQAVFDYLVT